jgi:hypothetical protein
MRAPWIANDRFYTPGTDWSQTDRALGNRRAWQNA